MEESHNPYAPPKSDIDGAADTSGMGRTKVYSPAQGWSAAFLGGPLVGTYIIHANFAALGDARRAKQAMYWGGAVSLLIVLFSPFLPERTPRVLLPLAYSMTARLIIERMQFTKHHIETSDNLTFHSNWRVAAVGLLGLVAFVALVVAEYFLIPSLDLGKAL